MFSFPTPPGYETFKYKAVFPIFIFGRAQQSEPVDSTHVYEVPAIWVRHTGKCWSERGKGYGLCPWETCILIEDWTTDISRNERKGNSFWDLAVKGASCLGTLPPSGQGKLPLLSAVLQWASKLLMATFLESQAVVGFGSFPALGYIPMEWTMAIHSWSPLTWPEAKNGEVI